MFFAGLASDGFVEFGAAVLFPDVGCVAFGLLFGCWTEGLEAGCVCLTLEDGTADFPPDVG